MVLTAAQTTAFFQDNAQMGIPAPTVAQMAIEGIAAVEDLADFDKESMQQLADNLRRPGGRVVDPNDPTATIPTPSFVFGARSQKRLLVACDLVRYYEATGRELTVANIRWAHVMKNFEIQWKALKAKKDEDTPDVPKITRSLPVIKWTEAFQDFLNRVIGVRVIPLIYVIRTEVAVPAAAPPLANNQPHSTEHGSIEAELIARASHTHPLFRDDNAMVYHYLEEATRTTSYAASIKPFQRSKDGRGAWLALTTQYAGTDKWEAEIKKMEQLLHTRVWKGQSNFSLEQFISQHRNAFVSMQACAEHVEYQLPNEHSRVGFLLDGIQCSDAGLQAAMASIKTDKTVNGLRNNFEAAASHLQPYDPVAKKRTAGAKRGASLISEVDATDSESAKVGATMGKPGIGKTGVHLRYHTHHEYKALTDEQRDELRDWKNKEPQSFSKSAKERKQQLKKGKGGGKRGQGNGKVTKSQISSMVKKQVRFALKEGKDAEESPAKDQDAALVMSLMKAIKNHSSSSASATASATNATPAVSPKTTYDADAITAIMKRARLH